jgi:hypothetical protein
MNGPDPRTGTEVQYPLRILAYGRKVKSSSESKAIDVMDQIHSVLFFFIIRLKIRLSHSLVRDWIVYIIYHNISSFVICVVTTAVLGKNGQYRVEHARLS